MNVCVLDSMQWIFSYSHWSPLTWLKSREHSPEAGWSQHDFSPISGGWWWLLADLESSVAENFNIDRISKADPLFAVCALYLVGSNK